MVRNPGSRCPPAAFFAVLFAAFLFGESVADLQQWRFQQAKRAAGGQLEPGFATSGLFAYSRHPNFFFEQAQWWVFYALGATAAAASGLGVWGGAINWTIAGAALLTLLFIGSTIFTVLPGSTSPRLPATTASGVQAGKAVLMVKVSVLPYA